MTGAEGNPGQAQGRWHRLPSSGVIIGSCCCENDVHSVGNWSFPEKLNDLEARLSQALEAARVAEAKAALADRYRRIRTLSQAFDIDMDYDSLTENPDNLAPAADAAEETT